MKHKKYSTNHKLQTTSYKGFSFIEVMLSVFLVSVGIMTTIGLISLGIKNSTQNRRQMIATMLSQEGIELVRNIRDKNAKEGVDSFNGISTGIIDYHDPTLRSGDEQLDYVDGFYRHGGGIGSQFHRRILISGAGEQRTVYSTVVWGGELMQDNPTEVNCNLSSKCVFTKITLNTWRE